MNKRDLAELAKANNIGNAVAVGGFVGIEGVDKSIDRVLLLDAIGRHMDRLGNIVGSSGDTVFDFILKSIPAVVISLAKFGYLTPEEIRRSKACNKFFGEKLEEVRKQEEAEAAAKREALEAAERMKAEAESLAARARAVAGGVEGGPGAECAEG